MSDRLPSEKELRLLRLTLTERAGREIAKLYEKESGERIAYVTLYSSLRRMREKGWISVREDHDQDGRLRFFRITGHGVEARTRARDHHERQLRLAEGEAIA